jgi:hypothetical protein
MMIDNELAKLIVDIGEFRADAIAVIANLERRRPDPSFDGRDSAAFHRIAVVLRDVANAIETTPVQ